MTTRLATSVIIIMGHFWSCKVSFACTLFIRSSQALNTVFVTWVVSLMLVISFTGSYAPIIMKHLLLIYSMVLHFPCGVVFLCLKVLTVSLLFRQADVLSEQHPSVKVTLNATFSLNIQLKILCSISASLHSASSQDVWVISHLCYLPSSYELKHFFIG